MGVVIECAVEGPRHTWRDDMERQKCSDGSYHGSRERMRLLGGYLLLSAIFEDKKPAAPKREIRLRGGHRSRITHLAPQRAAVR